MAKRSLNLNELKDTPVSRARIRSVCCWPDCGKASQHSTPLCGAHLMISHNAIENIRSGDPALARLYGYYDPEWVPDAPPARIVNPRQGTVYYVQVGSHVKIGWTADMETRMRNPPNSTLLAQHPGTRKDEAQMHRRFAADRTHGREWYVPSASLTRHIANVVREHGQPEAARFGAKPVEIPMPHRLVSQKMLSKIGPRHVS